LVLSSYSFRKATQARSQNGMKIFYRASPKISALRGATLARPSPINVEPSFNGNKPTSLLSP
jgi:hypothetical protein